MSQLELLTDQDDIEVSQLTHGMSFGEQALINLKPRAATIKCKEDSYLGVLSREDYNATIGKMQKR
jgi:CRP-like cAMP-binding protein